MTTTRQLKCKNLCSVFDILTKHKRGRYIHILLSSTPFFVTTRSIFLLLMFLAGTHTKSGLSFANHCNGKYHVTTKSNKGEFNSSWFSPVIWPCRLGALCCSGRGTGMKLPRPMTSSLRWSHSWSLQGRTEGEIEGKDRQKGVQQLFEISTNGGMA